MHDALLQTEVLKAKIIKFGCPTEFLEDLRLRLQKVFVLSGGYNLLCVTDRKILISDYRERITSVFESNAEEVLTAVNLVSTNQNQFFYATHNNSVQKSFINELMIDWPCSIKSQRKIFSSNSDGFVGIQLCRDNESLRSPNFTRKGDIVWTDVEVQLLVLDKNYVFYKLQANAEKNFDILETKVLNRVESVQRLVDNLKPFEDISITERTLSYRDKTICIDSGRSYDILDSCPIEYTSAISCKHLSGSDKDFITLHD